MNIFNKTVLLTEKTIFYLGNFATSYVNKTNEK